MRKIPIPLSANLILFIFFITVALSMQVKADRRYFGRSYLSYTPSANEFELEFWQTSRIGKSAGSFYSWQPRIELEYGVTDRFTTSFYINLIRESSVDNDFSSKPFSVSSSVEFRYRLTTPDEGFIDPTLYFEFVYGKEKVEYEPKIILTKRMGHFISAINIASAFEKSAAESEIETEFELTFGLAYDVTKSLALGIEFRNDRIFEEFYNRQINQAVYFGPTVNYSLGDINLVLNVLAQISGSPATKGNLELLNHEKYEVRMLIGIEL